METKTCERCGESPSGFDLLDYCGVCFKDLCDECMDEGCCNNIPAISGTQQDNEE